MHIVLELDGEPFELWLVREGAEVRVEVGGRTLDARVQGPGPFDVQVGGRTHRVEVPDATHAVVDGERVGFRIPSFAPGGAPGQHDEEEGGSKVVKPPMPGRIAALKVREGDTVQKGQILLVLEAMKMQNEVAAPRSGKVARIHVKPGDVVESGSVLVELEDA
ncbi:MAG: biotin/lipoyl-binding protein [Halobacteriales archaeon]|nr:biotin/lipoyl-binding protein [Halobacteriales archaeon]